MTTFAPFNRLKPCRHGTLLFNVNDMYIGRSLDAYGEFSEGEVEMFRQIVAPGHVVLEVGANLGAHTVFLAQTVGPSGHVVAFEPQRLVFQTLCANVALNNLTNVHCIMGAVGRQPGEITVPLLDVHREHNFGGLTLEGQQHGEKVPVYTIDGLNLPNCSLMKIDVEGMEQAVLEGAGRTIQQFRPLLYVENDRKEKAPSLIRLIDSLGYSMYWHLPPLFNPDNFAGNPENLFGRIVSMNMLCCPKERQQQVQGLQAVEVPGEA